MKLECENCQHAFEVKPSGADAEPFAMCPACDFPVPVPQAVELSPSSVPCFSCGKLMPAPPGKEIPQCEDCRNAIDPLASDPKDWMVRKVGGVLHGPFDLTSLKKKIALKELQGTDEVSKTGGAWRRFDLHPQFQALFDAPTGRVDLPTPALEPPPRETTPARAASRRLRTAFSRFDWGRLARSVVAVVGIIAVVYGSVRVSRTRLTVLPDSWLSELEARIAKFRKQETYRFAPPPMAEAFSVLLSELDKAHPKKGVPSAELFVRGRTLSLRGRPGDASAAEALLEEAVVANPQDSLALNALAELYCGRSGEVYTRRIVALLDQSELVNPGSAEYFRAKATFSLSNRQAAQARAEAKQALLKNPKEGEAYHLIGLSYLQEGKGGLVAARKAFESALEAEPSLQAAWVSLSSVYRDLHEYRKAHDAVKRKLEREANDPAALLELGRVLERIGEIDRALEAYDAAVRASGRRDGEEALELAILSYQARGQVSRARVLLTEVVKEGSSVSGARRGEALTHLAAVARMNGELTISLSSAEQALAIRKGDGPALFQKGLTLLQLGRYDEASAMIQAASLKNPPERALSDMRLHLALVRRAQKQFAAVPDELQAAIMARKTHMVARLLMISHLLSLGQDDKALAAVRDAARVDPLYTRRLAERTLYPNPTPNLEAVVQEFYALAARRSYDADALAAVGMLELQRDRWSDAVAAFQRALQIDQTNVVALLSLGILAGEQRQVGTSLEALTRANAQLGQASLANIYLGIALTQAERYTEADTAFEQAMRADRKQPALLDGLGVLYARRQDSAQARAMFLEALTLDPDYQPAVRHLYQYCP